MSTNILKEVEVKNKSYRLIEVNQTICIDSNNNYKEIVDIIKFVVQVRWGFIWVDIKEFVSSDLDTVDVNLLEAEELFNTITNPYKYG